MNERLKKIAITLVIPAGVFLFFSLLLLGRDTTLFSTTNHFRTFINAFAVTTFIAWALNFNLSTGRFDFSLGSISLLSSILGAKFMWYLENLGWEMNGWYMLIAIVVIGAVLGTISGLAYIILKIPPIVTSLGMTLIYEALGFIATDGGGVVLNRTLHLTKIASPQNQIIVLAIGFVAIYLISNKTSFGFHWRSLVAGQKIAVDTGINEKSNAVISYALSGAFVSVAGCFTMSIQGNASASLNFGTISTIFVAFLPLFIGGFIGRYSEDKFGILLGSFTTALITLGFVRLNISAQMQSFWNAIILLGFLIYLNNEYKILSFFTKKKRVNRQPE